MSGFAILEDSTETAALGYGEPDWEKSGEFGCMRHFIKDGMTVFDVGANDGEWAEAALNMARCTVHAFEPGSTTYTRMTERLYKYAARVEMYAYGLASKTGERTLYVGTPKAEGQKQASHISSVYLANVEQHPDCDYITLPYAWFTPLDFACSVNGIDHIDYLKIDTEGMELEVLHGAMGALANNRIDVVQFEYGTKYAAAGATLEAVWRLLSGHGFELYRIIPGGLLHTPVWHDGLECQKFCNYLATRLKI